MFHRKNVDGLAAIDEANAVTAGAQAKLQRLGATLAFDIALLGLGEPRQSMKDAHGGWRSASGDSCLVLGKQFGLARAASSKTR